MKELIKRTLSGIVYVGCVVGSILYDPRVFCGVFLVIALLAVDEFHRLVKSSGLLRFYSFMGACVLWASVQYIAWHVNDGIETMKMGFALALVYMPVVVLALLDEIWNHSDKPLQNWGNFLISQFMVALPLGMMSFLYFLDKWLLLALFVLIWVNDTGAYCVGSLTAKLPKGNHKMAPHVSPKKSWEGLIGGFVFTIGASVLLYRLGWFETIAIEKYGVYIAALFAFLVSAFGTMGDLMESLCKRSVGVKDSGVFLPGHGGVLDRFDSILLAAPILTAFCWLCYYVAPLL
jgi:phosphatidate cytidylyltransferase